jgi:hypothetical protein
MIEHFLRAGILVAIAALVVFGRPPSLHSQQPAASGYSWGVVANGVFADTRIRDAMGQLVDSQAVMKDAGVTTPLVYAGGGVNAPQTATKLDAIRMLLAAAGFNDPATQLREVRRCRIWMAAPFTPELGAVMQALGEEIAGSASNVGLRLQACEPASSLDTADFALWPASQAAPIPVNPSQPHPSADSFLAATDRPTPSVRGVSPPITGDGGLR